MDYEYDTKFYNCDCKRWSQSLHWLRASWAHSAVASNNLQSVSLDLKLSDGSKISVPLIDNGKYSTNIDRLYTPHFNIFCNTFRQPNSLSTLSSSKSIFHYCIISPLLKQDISLFSKFDGINFSEFNHSENWRTFSSNATTYWKNRPSVLLNTIRRKKSKCKKALCVFKIYNNISSELRQHYWHVYNKSWKPAEASPEFINWLLDYTSEQGLLRLGFTYIDSLPIAMHFWIVQDGTASIFKLAQDKEFDHLSPGTVLMAEMIDWVYAHDEIHCIDFLTGSDEYKKLWMDECRPLYGLEIFNMKTIRGRLLWYRHCVIRFLKSIRSRFNNHE